MRIATLLAICAMGLVVAAPVCLAGAAGRANATGAAARGALAARAGAAKAGGKTAAAARGGKLSPDQRIDKRESNQDRRINAGINRGQLTSDEAARLQNMENTIDTTETSFKSDGKLSKDEVKQLRQALNDASLQIWSERHDTEGSQKPVSRLGKDVFAQDSLTARLESPDLTKAQAKAFLEDFKKMVLLKRRLATENLTADQRAQLQSEYNDLVNEYFVTH